MGIELGRGVPVEVVVFGDEGLELGLDVGDFALRELILRQRDLDRYASVEWVWS